ncbi:MAG: 2,3-bisphosphoglycerate-independent phosphoglycerate mutase [bacterium]
MKKPVLLVIMDGVGFSASGIGDAVSMANTKTLDNLFANCPYTRLKAHGSAVGLPSDEDMGNSEVGHNALGCGQIYSQGAKLVNESISSGKIYESATWNKVVNNVKDNDSTLHFIGLLSDGNVHSNIAHLIAFLENAKKSNVKKVRCHVMLDGRDVPSTSALEYVNQLEETFAKLNDSNFDAKIASGGGRMKITMDRYEADWAMVETGYNTHVHGIGRQFATTTEAVETFRNENAGIGDQDLPAFVIAENGNPVGKIVDNDSVVLVNFRGDRAIEISMAFDNENFDKFDRGNAPKVVYAGILQYDGDLNIPSNFLVFPPEITNTLGEFLANNKLSQYAISETQKYGHVTYFFNGNKSGKFNDELETYVEIPSDNISFDKAPAMKCVEISEKLIEAMNSKKFDFLRVNYPNGDMVGHTGNLEATIASVEALDASLGKVLEVAAKNDVIVCITADHGNADEMLEKNKKGEIAVRTAHSLNEVPFIIVDNNKKYTLKDGLGLANVASTIADLFELKAPSAWEESIIK